MLCDDLRATNRPWCNCVSLEDSDRLDAHLPVLDPAQLLTLLSKTETGFYSRSVQLL